MHELSIAQSIIELAEDQARQHGANVIEEVELEIGKLAGVEIETLNIALDSARKGTMMENARIVNLYPRGEGYCLDCEKTFECDNLFPSCPQCGSNSVMLTKGKEMRIKSIVVK